MRDHERLLAAPYWAWRNLRKSRAELAEFQRRHLRRLLLAAYERVPFHRARFDAAGITPADIRNPADLAALPPTCKSDLRDQPLAEVIAHGAPRLIERRTSGSSGNPFVIRRTLSEDRLLFLLRLRARLLVGVRPTDRTAMLIEPRPAPRKSAKPLQRLQRSLGLMRTHPLDALRPPDRLFDELEKLAPDVLSGYPSTIERLAKIRRGREHSALRPRLILTGGETHRAPTRRAIEAAFEGVPVLDLYGAYEFNLVAWECPLSRKLHVCEDNVILEVLRDGRPAAPGEWGEVVVTGLHGHAMPFIRYRLGDVAMRAANPCPCGRPFSLLEGIQGRTVEYFELPGDRWVHPFAISGAFVEQHGDWIDRHQLIQESLNRVLLRLALRRPPPAGALASIRALGERALGDSVAFAIEIVDELEAAPSGKFHPYRALRVQPDPEPAFTEPSDA